MISDWLVWQGGIGGLIPQTRPSIMKHAARNSQASLPPSTGGRLAISCSFPSSAWRSGLALRGEPSELWSSMAVVVPTADPMANLDKGSESWDDIRITHQHLEARGRFISPEPRSAKFDPHPPHYALQLTLQRDIGGARIGQYLNGTFPIRSHRNNRQSPPHPPCPVDRTSRSAPIPSRV
jgi:hypothetical protein